MMHSLHHKLLSWQVPLILRLNRQQRQKAYNMLLKENGTSQILLFD
jgi:hypothetical protein